MSPEQTKSWCVGKCVTLEETAMMASAIEPAAHIAHGHNKTGKKSTALDYMASTKRNSRYNKHIHIR